MHSKSFSAHVPIKVHAALSFVKSSVPSYYAIPETMYVYFPGSHSIPRQTTGLGSGSVFGYIVAKKTVDNNFIIRYEGVNITQYEMSGQFPVYVTYTAPSIEKYDPVLYTSSPIINIATEEATNAFNQQEESKHNQLHQDMATLAIVAVSFIAAIPPANEFIDRYSARRAKSVKGNDTDNGYNGKSTNDH